MSNFIKEKYKIIRKIGVGGMATVYLVEDTLIKQPFAMKILHPHYSDNPKIRNRFLREAQLQMKLNHPNIVRCFDVNEYNDSLYILLEYIEGNSLYDYINNSTAHIPIDVFISIMIQVLAGMDHAHKNGVIHRDVKPHNILIAGFGPPNETSLVKLTDFGIAKALTLPSKTMTGTKLGTPYYMSPEQIENASHVDFRSDIFSLGVTFYQTLTNNLPYKLSTNPSELEVMEAIHKQPIIHPRHFRADCPKWLYSIILKMTEKNPNKRFSSCAEINDTLFYFLNKEEKNTTVQHPGRVNSYTGHSPKTDINSKTSKSSKVIWGIVGLLGLTVFLLTAYYVSSELKEKKLLASLLYKPNTIAIQKLKEANLPYVIKMVHHNDIDKNRIISADRKKDSIYLMVSNGPKRKRVPDISNKTVNDVISSIYSDDIPIKRIIKKPDNNLQTTIAEPSSILPAPGSTLGFHDSIILEINFNKEFQQNYLKTFSKFTQEFITTYNLLPINSLMSDISFYLDANTNQSFYKPRSIKSDIKQNFVFKVFIPLKNGNSGSGGIFIKQSDKNYLIAFQKNNEKVFWGNYRNGTYWGKSEKFNFNGIQEIEVELIRLQDSLTVVINGINLGVQKLTDKSPCEIGAVNYSTENPLTIQINKFDIII